MHTTQTIIPVWTIALMGLLSSCQQTTQTTMPVSTSPPGTQGTVSPITPDAVLWVTYAVSDLLSDTASFAQPRPVGTLGDAALTEASGLAASRRNPGNLWTEEDSGNPNQIQLLSQAGDVVARYTIDGAENRDWEDIAVGPGPVAGETYIYLADIGDNKRRYSEKIIYRFPEPALAGQKLPVDGHITNVEVIRLQLTDGPQNAEAILLDPATKDLFILSKGDRSALYRAAFPQSLTQVTLMTPLLLMPFDNVTSAAVSPDGGEILIRTYGQLFYYKHQSGEPILESLKRAPHLLPLANEAQGEAVGWAIDGSGYYTTSEKVDATSPAVYFYQRKK